MSQTISEIDGEHEGEKWPETVAPSGPQPLMRLWGGLRLFLPFYSGRRYLNELPLWQAAGVAAFNVFFWFVWIVIYHATLEWYSHGAGGNSSEPMSFFLGRVATSATPPNWWTMFQLTAHNDWAVVRQTPLVEIIPAVGGMAIVWFLSTAMLYFILLPFVARHGSNKACALQVLKVSLLGTGISHLVGVALIALIAHNARSRASIDLNDDLIEHMAVVCVICIYGFITLAHAAKVDYRRPADMPKRPEPLCEKCGYNLSVSPMDGRCPECGRPVIESLGPGVRVPTPWERSGQWWNPLAIARVARDMVFHPMQTFARMPGYTGKNMVERWLVVSVVLIAAEAFFLWPLTRLLTEGRGRMDDSQLYVGSFVLAATWAGLALMMVGIETAGVAIVAHYRGQHVDLATAAKVTGYASILLLFWIFIGSIHLLASYFISLHPEWHVFNARFRPYAFLVTLSIAQIGGLLWFEWTVYRGLRVVRFANT
jgi:hypothetical protein